MLHEQALVNSDDVRSQAVKEEEEEEEEEDKKRKKETPSFESAHTQPDQPPALEERNLQILL